MPNGNQQPPVQQITLDIKDCEEIKCTGCEDNIFEQYFMFRFVPAMVSRSGQKELLTLPVYKCISCGQLLELKK